MYAPLVPANTDGRGSANLKVHGLSHALPSGLCWDLTLAIHLEVIRGGWGES